MSILWRLFCLPGYVLLAFAFFFPTEWGKNRNVSMSGRQWRNKHAFAPIYSVIFYGCIALIFFADHNQENEPVSYSSQANLPVDQKQEKYDPTVFCRAARTC